MPHLLNRDRISFGVFARLVAKACGNLLSFMVTSMYVARLFVVVLGLVYPVLACIPLEGASRLYHIHPSDLRYFISSTEW